MITGGNGPTREQASAWVGEASLIVAADSGLLLARAWGIRPDLIVGDFDSLEPPSLLDEYPDDTVFRFPSDKDETDTEIAIRFLHERGIGTVRIAGGGGGRLDHLLGILALFDREPAPGAWMTDTTRFELISGCYRGCGRVGRVVSLFPAGCRPCRMQSTGLKWPLDGLVWERGAIGVSNVAIESCVEITMLRGRLMLVEPMEHA